MKEIMNEEDVKWIWNRLQNVIDAAEEEHSIHPGLVTWSYLRFSTSLHFQRFSDPGLATMMALDILMGTIREHQEEESEKTGQADLAGSLQDEDPVTGTPPGFFLQ